jgi:hypothetical protein
MGQLLKFAESILQDPPIVIFRDLRAGVLSPIPQLGTEPCSWVGYHPSFATPIKVDQHHPFSIAKDVGLAQVSVNKVAVMERLHQPLQVISPLVAETGKVGRPGGMNVWKNVVHGDGGPAAWEVPEAEDPRCVSTAGAKRVQLDRVRARELDDDLLTLTARADRPMFRRRKGGGRAVCRDGARTSGIGRSRHGLPLGSARAVILGQCRNARKFVVRRFDRRHGERGCCLRVLHDACRIFVYLTQEV